jgi:hypothetical protein
MMTPFLMMLFLNTPSFKNSAFSSTRIEPGLLAKTPDCKRTISKFSKANQLPALQLRS